MVDTYLFTGVVLPERAQLSLKFGLRFSILASGEKADAKVSVILNQIAVTVETNSEIDIFDLRNVVKNILQGHLAMIGFIHGHTYDFEVTRVINSQREIDFVFGIDIPDLSKRHASFNPETMLSRLRDRSIGEAGIFVRRCLNDLVFAMKYADDTEFYCYRAIESLRHHCAALNGLSGEDRKVQWNKFSEVTGYDERSIAPLTKAATPARHGEVRAIDAA